MEANITTKCGETAQFTFPTPSTDDSHSGTYLQQLKGSVSSMRDDVNTYMTLLVEKERSDLNCGSHAEEPDDLEEDDDDSDVEDGDEEGVEDSSCGGGEEPSLKKLKS